MSSDGVVRIGQSVGIPRESSLYDPPEAARGEISPARDVWSLGVTLVEALTQHPPSRQEMAKDPDLLPQSLPTPFADIVRNCLRPAPEQRWSVDRIAASLTESPSATTETAAMLTPKVSRPAPAATANQATFAKPGRLIAASLVALTLLVMFFVKLLHHAPVGESSAISSREPVPQQASPEPPPAVVPESAPQTTPTPVIPTPAIPLAPESTNSGTAGAVLQKVLPEVPRSASKTIHGTIRVMVRVNVNPAGDVSSATLTSSGSSAYFAKLALQSAYRWRFPPAKKNGESGSRTWVLKFEFRNSGTRATASPAR